MKRLPTIAKWVLLVWGGVSIVATLAIIGLITYQFGYSNRDRTDKASPDDVRFVLNWCNLGDNRIEKVIHSYVSARSLTGDHLDAYAIKISHVTPEELTANTDESPGRWYRGDRLPKVVDAAIPFAGGWLESKEIAWFPKESELRSSEIFVYPCSIRFRGVVPTAAEFIFIRPKDNMVFYFSGKT